MVLGFFLDSFYSQYNQSVFTDGIGKMYLGVPLIAALYYFDPFIGKEIALIYVAAMFAMFFYRNIDTSISYKKHGHFPTYKYSGIIKSGVPMFILSAAGMVYLHEVNITWQRIAIIAIYLITCLGFFPCKLAFEKKHGFEHRKKVWEMGEKAKKEAEEKTSNYSYEQFKQKQDTGYGSNTGNSYYQNDSTSKKVDAPSKNNRFINLSEDEARKLYKTLQKKYHPDNPKTGNLTESKKINEEYLEYQKYHKGA